MKRILWIVAAAALLVTGCKKKEEPPAGIPHVAGVWAGRGTDDTIGYFDVGMDLEQEGSSVHGTFHTSSGYGTTSGKVTMELAPPVKGSIASIVVKMRMERDTFSSNLCAATFTLPDYDQHLTSTGFGFYYKGTDCNQSGYNGGMTIDKIAATN